MSPTTEKRSILITGYVNPTLYTSYMSPGLLYEDALRVEQVMRWHWSLRPRVSEYSQLLGPSSR